MHYTVILIETEEGTAVSCPALPGCHSQGATRDEALANIREAITLWLEVAEEDAERELVGGRCALYTRSSDGLGQCPDYLESVSATPSEFSRNWLSFCAAAEWPRRHDERKMKAHYSTPKCHQRADNGLDCQGRRAYPGGVSGVAVKKPASSANLVYLCLPISIPMFRDRFWVVAFPSRNGFPFRARGVCEQTRMHRPP